MANNAENTMNAFTSVLYKLPDDTDLSIFTDITVEVPEGSTDYGYFSEDGEVYSQSPSITKVKAHQNNDVVRTLVSDADHTLAVNFIEDTPAVRNLYYANVEDGSGKTIVNPYKVSHGKFYYSASDTAEGFEKTTVYVFEADVTPNGDITYAAGDNLVNYPVLFTFVGDVIKLSSVPTES